MNYIRVVHVYVSVCVRVCVCVRVNENREKSLVLPAVGFDPTSSPL